MWLSGKVLVLDPGFVGWRRRGCVLRAVSNCSCSLLSLCYILHALDVAACAVFVAILVVAVLVCGCGCGGCDDCVLDSRMLCVGGVADCVGCVVCVLCCTVVFL